MDFYFDTYCELSLQRLMVADRPRTDAFAAALEETVAPGMRVIDVGAGTGLLAMLAARAGAARVYALEQADVAKVARHLVERNGLADTVEVVHANARDFQLAEPADLIVSEWLGHFAFAETMLDDALACRDENLEPGGTMLPARVELMLAPLDSPYLYCEEGPGAWRRPVRGLDFSSLEEMELEQALAVKRLIAPADLLAPGKPIVALDLAAAGREEPWQSGSVEFVARRAGCLNGFAGWFSAQLSPSVTLDTGPGQPETHWQQTYFAFPPVPVRAGQALRANYALARHPVEPRSVELQLEVESRKFNYTIG